MKKLVKKNWQKVLCIVCVLSLFASFTAGCSIGKKSKIEQMETKASKIESVIDKYYLNDVDEENVTENVYKGIMNGLDDPYSVYYTKKEYEKLQEETTGTYVGIGVSVRMDTDTGYIKVVKAFENGPAYKVGIKDGDYITKVKGKDVAGKELENVIGDIKGEEGTTVDVTVYRASDDKYYDYTIKRANVDVPTIEYEMLDNQIGYIKVAEFDDITSSQYIEALNNLEKQNEKGLIVDLRDNPGGVLSVVVEMLNHMLPKGTIVYTEDKNGKGESYYSDGKHPFTKPLVVLVNGNSASASEIFTGAVKDYGIGTIVGTKTFGKGIVQRLFPLDDGTAIKLTVSKYFTPNGTCIHGEGIKPDVEVEYDASKQTGKEYNKEQDNQLQKAIEVMNEKITKSEK